MLSIFFWSLDFTINKINSKNAFLNPSFITSFLSKLISNGLETSMLSISKAFTSILSVEKKIYLEIELKKKYIRF